MDTTSFQNAICLQAHSNNTGDELSMAIGRLLHEAFEKRIVPSFIDFNLTPDNEMALTLYAYRKYALEPA